MSCPWEATGTCHASSREYHDVRLAGLYDVGEERHLLRGFACRDRGELERVGFYACVRDLEDELTRAVGPDGMEVVLAEQDELRAFRTFQKQPAHRDRPLEEQLHSFMWNRKQRYAVLLVEALRSSACRGHSSSSWPTSSSIRPAPAGVPALCDEFPPGACLGVDIPTSKEAHDGQGGSPN